jgi:RHS repeat-associated protein
LQFVGRYGGYLDNDTGLTYFWHRWYDSKDGRWISRDPIGTAGGINLYGYTKNRPLTYVDPVGYGNEPVAKPIDLWDLPGENRCKKDLCKLQYNACCSTALNNYYAHLITAGVLDVACATTCQSKCFKVPFCMKACTALCTFLILPIEQVESWDKYSEEQKKCEEDYKTCGK